MSVSSDGDVTLAGIMCGHESVKWAQHVMMW